MNSIQCEKCSQTFSSRYCLMRHMRNKHVGGMSYPNVCLPPVGLSEYQGAPGKQLGAPSSSNGVGSITNRDDVIGGLPG